MYIVLQSELDKARFYLGSTKGLRRRLELHNAGENKATRGHQWRLVYYEAYISDNAARQREHKLKAHGKVKQVLMQRIKESLES